MTLALDGLRVIDADTHLTEAHDLWTKRAPAKYADRVPHVVEVDGKPMWYVDGAELGFAGGGGVIDRDGGKGRAAEALFEWTQDQIHLGAFDIPARIDVMNDSGIHAQVCFPNSIGLGGPGHLGHREGPRAPPALRADLQRRHGRGAGGFRSAPAPHAGAAGLGRRRGSGRGQAGCLARPAWREHHVGPQRRRRSGPGQSGLGPVVGGLRRPAPARALPHRCQPHHDDLLRHLPLGVTGRGHEAGHRRDACCSSATRGW